MGGNRFARRTIKETIHVLAVTSHLEEHLSKAPMVVRLEISPRIRHRTDYQSIKGTATVRAKIGSENDIRKLERYLLENWAYRKIIISIKNGNGKNSNH